MQGLIERAARDLVAANYAVALTGAGISTESGIPDFRGPNGIWTKHPEMEKRAYEMYHQFLADPKRFWEQSLARPSLIRDTKGVKPNPGHYALGWLEKMGILKCLITQNVDNLHQRAGSERVLDYHGNVDKLRCMRCGNRYFTEEYDLQALELENKLPPVCRECNGMLKPDVVYFNEPIPRDVAEESQNVAQTCDLMLICGTSAVVYPFANLPRMARRQGSVTIIEVNGEPTALTKEHVSDYLIQGKTGVILPQIVAAVEKIKAA